VTFSNGSQAGSLLYDFFALFPVWEPVVRLRLLWPDVIQLM
jgi:hypothetical protein